MRLNEDKFLQVDRGKRFTGIPGNSGNSGRARDESEDSFTCAIDKKGKGPEEYFLTLNDFYEMD